MLTTMTRNVGKTASMTRAAKVRPRRDFAAMEARRMRAADLFAKGVSQADIARELGVAHQTVSDWHDKWLVGGKRALKRTGPAGRPPKVTPVDLAKVGRALERGPAANGFSTDLWTLARVAEVIETVTGVHYHPGHVWRVLRQMGWSRQRPARQATERDDAAIERWVNERWPKVKKTPQPGGRGSSSKTRAGSASCPSSAPRGRRRAGPRSSGTT
jgi:transposase